MAEPSNSMAKLTGNGLAVGGLAVGLIIIALALGLAGGVIFTRLFPQDTTQNIPELENESNSRLGFDDRRENPVQRFEPPPAQQNKKDKEDEAARLAAQRAQAERTRIEERRRLAYDSPLTPGIANAAAMAKQANTSNDGRNSRTGGTETQEGGTSSVATSSVATSSVARGATSVSGTAVSGTSLTNGGNSLTSNSANTSQNDKLQGDKLHLLARGSVIPTILESPIDSELPGLVRARVAEDIRDSITGTHILIPRGSVLIGTYGSDTRSGQQRLFVAWTDLRMPDGTIHDFDRFSSLDADGAAGIVGKRKTGFLKAFGAAVLFDLAGNATQILTSIINPKSQQTTNSNDGLASLIAQATGSATQRVSDQYIGSILNRGPRFSVKEGAIMNVLIEKNTKLPAVGS